MPTVSHRAALLDLLRLDPPAHDAAWFASVDWDAVLAYAGASLAPLVLRGIGPRRAMLPPPVRDELQTRQVRMAQKRLLTAAVISRTCRALADAEVPFIALKGAALASQVYPDPVLRPMSDIDLWIPPERVGDALRALAAQGFRDSGRAALATAVALETREWRLEKRGAPVEIELHSRLVSLEGLPWADFRTAWDAGEDADLGGSRCRVLCPEHQLTHVGLHLSRVNRFTSGLSHLVDVARIVDRSRATWDWPRLARDWHRQLVGDWMLLALVLARDLLGAPVPPGIEGRSDDPDWRAMLAIAEEQLWEGRAHQLPPAVARLARLETPAEVVGWLRRRLVDHYWRSPAPRPPGRILADAAKRLWLDLTVKVPTYFQGLRTGALRGRNLASGRELERRRSDLERLVAARAAAAASPPGADVAGGPERR